MKLFLFAALIAACCAASPSPSPSASPHPSPAPQAIVRTIGGGYNLNSAYSAIYAQPGVTSRVGTYGWGQLFYIRGAASNETGYEFDGVPVKRAYDNNAGTSLSDLGMQDVDVYAGGAPVDFSTPTLGAVIDQVVKTGTSPGFAMLRGGIGTPAFMHELLAEAGGANPARTVSYYVGLSGYDQYYSYWNNNQYGVTSPFEIATLLNGLYCLNFGEDGTVMPQCPDSGAARASYVNGPYPACRNGGYNGGIANGYTAVNPGPLGGACFGYGVFGAGYPSFQEERNTVANFHFALPHRNDGGRDDVQLLYENSMQYLRDNSDIGSNGGLAFVSGYLNQLATFALPPWLGTSAAGLCGYESFWGLGCAQTNSPIPYIDSSIWTPGTTFGSNATTAGVVPYYFPNSPSNRALNYPYAPTAGIAANVQDGSWNNSAIVKLQYTKNITSEMYARLLAYTMFSDTLAGGPGCASTQYLDRLLQPSLCGNAADYELTTHTRGAQFTLADQVDSRNLLTFTASYSTSAVSGWNNSNTWLQGSINSDFSTNLTNLDPNNPMCFNAGSGLQGSCYAPASHGTTIAPTHGQAFDPCDPLVPALPAGAPACVNHAKWYVTAPSGMGTYNAVKPEFTAVALQDDLRPNSRWNLNVGVRFDNFKYDLADSNTPEFNFFFNAFAQIACYDPATLLPMLEAPPTIPSQQGSPQPLQTEPFAPCGTAPSGREGLHPVGGSSMCGQTINAGTPFAYTAVDCGSLKYTAQSSGSYAHGIVSPRVSGTYTLGANDVLRFALGRYAQPTESAFEQYLDQSGQRAAVFDFTHFWGLGFNTPAHDNPVQYSDNFDFSLEHHFANSDWTAKVTPFYRDTHNETVAFALDPGFVSGVNVGRQHSYGVELAVAKGDPAREGWSGQLSYTYTKALMQYGSLANGTNAIDYLNNYVKAFNALTQGGGGAQCYAVDGLGPAASNSPAPGCVLPAGDPAGTQLIANPYFGMAQQQLLDRNGWYPAYGNQMPSDPMNQGGSSAVSPHMFAGWLQWKRRKLAIAPNFELIAGTYYGSPTDVYGVDPRACSGNQGNAINAQGQVVNPGSNLCDYLLAGKTPFTASGDLAIPNPYTGAMDRLGAFQEPWIFNMGALIRYDISARVTANLNLANIYNRCFGGTSTAWQKAFPANAYVCGYGQGNTTFVGTTPGAGFFWGNSPTAPVNGATPYAPAYNYPFVPAGGAVPFEAYLELEIKL